MRIWVDGQALQTASKHRGIGRYIIQFLRALKQKHPDYRIQISFNAALSNDVGAARDMVADIVAPEDIFIWESVASKGEFVEGLDHERLLSELFIANHVANINPDVAISPSPFEGAFDKAVPLLNKFGHHFPIVSIFHDAIPFRYPDIYLPNPIFKQAYQRRLEAHKNFDHNLANSNFSNKELRSILKVKNTTPIYAGVSKIFSLEMLGTSQTRDVNHKPVNSISKSTRLKTNVPYLLYVGGLDWRKNVRVIIDAFNTKFLRQHAPVKFLIAGDNQKAQEDELRERWSSYGLRDEDLNIVGLVTDEELVTLYKNAKAVLQPSYMEGFGLTALEAIGCGTPVIASNQGALPEIVSNEKLLFSPSDHDDLAQKIVFLLNNPEKAASMVAENIGNVKHLTWENTVTLALDVINKIVRERSPRDKIKDPAQITLAVAKKIPLDAKIKIYGLANSEVEKPANRRLLVDVTSTTRVDHGTGIQRVVNSVCDNLLQGKKYEETVIFTYSESRERFRVVNKTVSEPFRLTKKRPKNQIDISGSDTVLMLDSSWEFHAGHKVQLNSARIKGAKIVTVLYDLVPIRTPAFCDQGMPILFSKWLRDALEYSTGFVCISKAVADEFITLLNGIKFPRPVSVGFWHLGADFNNTIGHERRPQPETLAVNPDNFLMVGTLEPRKGHSIVLSAFETLWGEGLSPQLTIVGKAGWNMEAFIEKLEAHPELGKRLFVKTKADDAELSRLYAETDALISASFSEGFGLPLVEAAHFNKPIIASDIPVFREVSKGTDATFFKCGSSIDLVRVLKEFKLRQRTFSEDKSTSYKSLSWGESTVDLTKVVLKDEWYHHYVPKTVHDVEQHPLGILSESDDLQNQLYELELAQTFEAVSSSGEMQCVVKITNRSGRPWASVGPDGTAAKGVMLACRVENNIGDLQDKNIRTKIPFSLVPSLPYYLAVNVSRADYDAGKAFHIGLMQEGVKWWANTIVISKNR